MKHALLVLFLSSLLLGCKETPQKKAEKLVDIYLKENLKDPDSYQNIKIGKLKEFTLEGLFIQEDLRKTKAKEVSSDGWADRLIEFRNTIKEKGMRPDSLLAYTMEHSYRAKNSFGGYVKRKVKYYFDSKIEDIIDVQDLDEK